MPTFVEQMLEKHSASSKPEDIVQEFVAHYKALHAQAVAMGRHRRLSYLSSAQSNLSKFKKQIEAPIDFKKKLHLSKEDTEALLREKGTNLHNRSIDLRPIPGDDVVTDCRKLLNSDVFELEVISLACLTGRRMAEIIHTAQFGPPREPHRLPHYWTNVSGLLKQRSNPRACEAPLFERREKILEVLGKMREKARHILARSLTSKGGPTPNLSNVTAVTINRVFGKKIALAMKRYCPALGHIHAFRNFYVLMADKYFNDRNCSLSRLGSDILCHREMSSAVLPYLNTKLDPEHLGRLTFP